MKTFNKISQIIASGFHTFSIEFFPPKSTLAENNLMRAAYELKDKSRFCINNLWSWRKLKAKYF